MSPFYSAFDCETHRPRGAQDGRDARSPFQVDRDRVLFSYAFRRLQSKTQVFQSGEYDFYRTRLTHTLEVARIARSIAEALAADAEPGAAPDPDLVEAVGYAHDLGHPPFGHIGERKLNELMAQHGGFEGNAQTLRILTDLIFDGSKGPRGMNPTRAFLDGVLKYKALHSEQVAALDGVAPDNHFLYDEQHCWRDWVFQGMDPANLPATPEGWNAVKSIECQIMDWADDTAYSLHDIVDGVRAGFLTEANIKDWRDRLDGKYKARGWPELVDELLQAIRDEQLEAHIGRRIGIYIHGCRLVASDGPFAQLGNRYRYRLEVDERVEQESAFKKKLAVDLIFRSPAIQQVEFRGGHALERLFAALHDHYIEACGRPLEILPEPHGSRIRALGGSDTASRDARARLVCDFLAGLTDGQAVRLYRRLFEPGGNSLGLLG